MSILNLKTIRLLLPFLGNYTVVVRHYEQVLTVVPSNALKNFFQVHSEALHTSVSLIIAGL